MDTDDEAADAVVYAGNCDCVVTSGTVELLVYGLPPARCTRCCVLICLRC